MFIKMNCLLVIGILIVLNCEVEAKVPGKVIIQLHHVVKLLKVWVKHNQDVFSRKFINRVDQLGYHVSHILSRIPPRDSDLYLWQLNMFANQIEVYYMALYGNEHCVGGEMTNSINEQISNFLQMIEDRLKAKIGRFQNLKQLISKHKSNESLLDKIIQEELNNLGLNIQENMESSTSTSIGYAIQGDISAYHPRNLYLNDIISSTLSVQLISDSHLVKWNVQNFQQLLAVKHMEAVCESGNTNGQYSQLMDLRHFVYVQIILSSVIGHLDVHFNAYRLHAQKTGNMGHELVWNSVLDLLIGFVEYFPPEYNSAVNDVYHYLIEAPRLVNPRILRGVCRRASELLEGQFTSLFPLESRQGPAALATIGMRTTEYELIDIVRNVENYPEQFMSIALENHQQLEGYLNNLKSQFENVDSSKLVYFLNM